MHEPGNVRPPDNGATSLLGNLLLLIRRARKAETGAELGFIAANETRLLAPYRQAAIWFDGRGILALSGVVAPEANAPYAQWLQRVCAELYRRPASADFSAACIAAPDLLPELAAEWGEWLPPHALWLPCPVPELAGGLLLAREEVWTGEEHGVLSEWFDAWSASWALKHKPTAWQVFLRTWQRLKTWRPTASLRHWGRLARERHWRELWQSRGLRWLLIMLLILFFPVRLTVLAPGELVPANPAVIRAPMDGIIDRVLVQPNQAVKTGDLLFAFDRIVMSSRLTMAEQALATLEAEYRQAAQQALFDAKSKAQLALVQGRLAEKQSEVKYLRELDVRSGVTSPRDGIVMFGDATEWVGRPVSTGERVMVVAGETDAEVEAWLSPADMIDLPNGAPVRLYLDTSPLSPVTASLRHVAHVAQQRPDGYFAYRLRAHIDSGEPPHRVGLKGSVKVAGRRVPLIYWIMRKPWAALRQFVGW